MLCIRVVLGCVRVCTVRETEACSFSDESSHPLHPRLGQQECSRHCHSGTEDFSPVLSVYQWIPKTQFLGPALSGMVQVANGGRSESPQKEVTLGNLPSLCLLWPLDHAAYLYTRLTETATSCTWGELN